MIQRQFKIEGQLAACRTCGNQPRAYHVIGRGRFLLECAPCGTRTSKYDTFQEAVEAWEAGEMMAMLGSRA